MARLAVSSILMSGARPRFGLCPLLSRQMRVASAQSSEGLILGSKIHNLSGLACPVYHHRYQESPASFSKGRNEKALV